jgi:hypothetical protein
MRTFVAIVALLALCGCASPPASPTPTIGQSNGQYADNAESCYRQMLASREVQALKGRLPPLEFGSLPSQAQQADGALATPEEVKLVLSYHQKHVVPCRQDGLVSAGRLGPEVTLILVESFVRADANYLKLIEGQISWGEYNREVHALRVDTRARLGAAIQEIQADRQDLAREAGQRQAAMIALDNWRRQQQALIARQRRLNPQDPARLNDCTYFGTTVSCAVL